MPHFQQKLTLLVLALSCAFAPAATRDCDSVADTETTFMASPRHKDHLYYQHSGSPQGLCKVAADQIRDGKVTLTSGTFHIDAFDASAQTVLMTDEERASLELAGYTVAQYINSGASSFSEFMLSWFVGRPAPQPPPGTEPNAERDERPNKTDGLAKNNAATAAATPTPQPERMTQDTPRNDPKPTNSSYADKRNPPAESPKGGEQPAAGDDVAAHAPGNPSSAADGDSPSDVRKEIRRELDARNAGDGFGSGGDLINRKGPPHFESKAGRRTPASTDGATEAEREALYAKERAELEWNRRAQELLGRPNPSEADMIAALKDLLGLDPDMSVADSLSDLFSDDTPAGKAKRKKAAAGGGTRAKGGRSELASAIDPYGGLSEDSDSEETGRARTVSASFGSGGENPAGGGSGGGASDDDIWIAKSVVLSNNSAISAHLVEKLIRKLTGAAKGEVAVWEKPAAATRAAGKLDRSPASKPLTVGAKLRRVPPAIGLLFVGGALLFVLAALRRRREPR